MYNTFDVPARSGDATAPASIIGKAVTGRDFFGRDQELADLGKAVGSQHVMMLAPRRTGKTSLMLALTAQEQARGQATSVYASVAEAATELDFVRTVLHAAYETEEGKSLRPGWFESWRQRRKSRVKKVEVAGTSVELDGIDPPWQQMAEEGFRKLMSSARPWLILIDELPALVLALAQQDPSGARVRAFLHWFRNLRQLPAAEKSLRFVLAGSIGLDAVTRRYDAAESLSDLMDWRLGPFDRGTAERFVTSLAEAQGMLLVPAVQQRLLEETEWLIPFHLQVLVCELVRCKRSLIPRLEDVDAAVEAALCHKLYFATWNERLHEVFGRADAEVARRVLTACAHPARGATSSTLQTMLAHAFPDPVERSDKQRWIMDVLENDGYLEPTSEQRWRFRSALLRRYWQRRFS